MEEELKEALTRALALVRKGENMSQAAGCIAAQEAEERCLSIVQFNKLFNDLQDALAALLGKEV